MEEKPYQESLYDFQYSAVAFILGISLFSKCIEFILRKIVKL
jgi:hypothetical protein